MMMSHHERVGKALELLRAGLAPFVEREIREAVRTGGVNMETVRRFAEDPILKNKPLAEWDAASLLKLMWETWNDVFRSTLASSHRSLVSEIRDWRNKWAHQERFTSDDAERALDSMERLLTAISAPQAGEVGKMRQELRRQSIEEQVRNEKRKMGGSLIEAAAAGALSSWRDVITPHPDVAGGRYQQAEFAADLWQVHLGEGSDEYRDPVEFFRRTFLTASLKRLLVGAAQRLSGQGGDPVVQLQTNFGGGKTHSMLALYHLFSGVEPTKLEGVDRVLAEAGVTRLPQAKRVVLVGNKISPGTPVTKPDGTVVRTLWGELAWQIGGREAYERIASDDERATNPGDALRRLFIDYGPCLILIDEWVAYARQLHDEANLPAGSFETQFSFAQALTESAKLAGTCLLVISLPASDTRADDVEVGGLRGREALERLRNVVGRVESSWRPASAEEGFEIVRRRLFQPLSGPEAFRQRDITARAFADFYRKETAEFPPECRGSDYEKRIREAYPIHPEIFDRLYEDWSTLVTFQRTRGVLRLMAAVIHSLWERGDRNPLILPATIPMDDPRVQFELTRYLSDNWTPIIEKDVDGPNALPLKIDNEQSNLGRYHATRRVARTIFLGSAPTTGVAHRGIEDRRIKLGSVMPGEPPAVFGDALRRLATAATYLYQDGTRFWYDTQPTVAKLAEDRAEQYKREPRQVQDEIARLVRENVREKGDFAGVHTLPLSPADVTDDRETRLVILRPEYPHSQKAGGKKEAGSQAIEAACAILESRGNAPRRFRNTLVFLAVDETRRQDLEEAVCHYLAWSSILEEKEKLDLSPNQVRQAEGRQREAKKTLEIRLAEAYQWLLVPVQETPQSPLTWQSHRLSGQEPLAVHAARKLRAEEHLLTALAGTRLRMELDRIPLWQGDHIALRQLIEYFASHVYLPRLRDSSVLIKAVADGTGILTWEREGFAYADDHDEASGRYIGLRCGKPVEIGLLGDGRGFVVKPEAARRQQRADEAAAAEAAGAAMAGVAGSPPAPGAPASDGGRGRAGMAEQMHISSLSREETPPIPRYKRYYGSVELNPARVSRDAGQIAEEVIAHLAGLTGVNVRVILEIEACASGGFPDNIIRIITENGRSLKFSQNSFEKE